MRPPLFPKPKPQLFPNTLAYESQPMVKPTGFREYDARWLFEKEIDLMGVQALGLGLARLLKELGVPPDVVVGHDFRSYSASIKLALTAGLMAGAARVRDIGLAITPMAYFAQFALQTPAVAMVTASHNDNGWTGMKMGAARPVTFGPEEMGRLKDIVIGGDYSPELGGAYEFVPNFPALAPKLLGELGVEVMPLDASSGLRGSDCRARMHAMAEAVKATGADVALGFDGDGDRCGVVDNEGTASATAESDRQCHATCPGSPSVGRRRKTQ